MLTARVLAGRSTRFWGYVDHDRKDHDEAYRETQGSRPASVSHLHHPLSQGSRNSRHRSFTNIIITYLFTLNKHQYAQIIRLNIVV